MQYTPTNIMKHQTLLLTSRDIRKTLDMRRAIPIVEKAFKSYGLGHAQMPPKSYLFLNKFNGDFRSMPAYLDDLGAVGVKWVNAHPENQKFNLPPVMALVILGDAKTGYPLSVMDATYLTNLRTGAGGAVAAKYLARKNSKIAAFVGTGNQARTQLLGLLEIFPIKVVKAFSVDQKSEKLFIEFCGKQKVKTIFSKSIRECVQDADIAVTTTPSRKPIVKREWISPGTHINAIGADAPGKEELDPAILKSAKVVIDDWEQASHSGEINVPISKGILKKGQIYASLGQIVAQKKKGRTSASEITIFDSTGLSIQDIACADFIYHQALKKRYGKFISFF